MRFRHAVVSSLAFGSLVALASASFASPSEVNLTPINVSRAPALTSGAYLMVLNATQDDGESVNGHLPNPSRTIPVDVIVTGSQVDLVETQVLTLMGRQVGRRIHIATGTLNGSTLNLRTLQDGATIAATMQTGSAPAASGTFRAPHGAHSMGGTFGLGPNLNPMARLPPADGNGNGHANSGGKLNDWSDPPANPDATSTSSNASTDPSSAPPAATTPAPSWATQVSNFFSSLFTWAGPVEVSTSSSAGGSPNNSSGTSPSTTGNAPSGSAYCPNPPCRPVKAWGK